MNKKGQIGLQRISWQHKRYMFIALTVLGGLLIFEPTTGIVSWIFDYKLEFAPFLGVRNLVGLGLLYLSIAITYQQVA